MMMPCHNMFTVSSLFISSELDKIEEWKHFVTFPSSVGHLSLKACVFINFFFFARYRNQYTNPCPAITEINKGRNNHKSGYHCIHESWEWYLFLPWYLEVVYWWPRLDQGHRRQGWGSRADQALWSGGWRTQHDGQATFRGGARPLPDGTLHSGKQTGFWVGRKDQEEKDCNSIILK